MTDVRTHQAELFASVRDYIAAGYRVAMTRIGVDPVKNKKIMVPGYRPAERWQLQPPPDLVSVTDLIKGGYNAFLYRLPDDVWVLDADNAAAVDWLRLMTGRPPDVTTPRGAHWLVTGKPSLPADAPPGIDTEPRQLYGPGSFYEHGSYHGAPVPLTAVLQCPIGLQAAPGVPERTVSSSAPLSSAEAFLAPPPITHERAMVRLTEMLGEIASGEYGGEGARKGIMRAAMFAGGLLHSGWFTYEQAANGIAEACAHRWGMADENDLRWIADGLADGTRKPLRVAPAAGEVVPGKEADGYDARCATPDEIDAEPEPPSLVAGVIDAGTFGLIYGPGGSGKSFVALDLALCIASGRPWNGHATTQGSVCYVAAEGRRGAGKRTKAWRALNQTVEPRGSLAIYGQAVDLFGQADPGDWSGFCAWVLERGFAAVVIDTYNRCTPGLEENSSKDTGVVVRAITQLTTLGVTVIVLHHTPKDGGKPRGSAALEWATDWGIEVTKKGNAVTVVGARQKDRDDGEKLAQLALVTSGESAGLVMSLEEAVTDSHGEQWIQSFQLLKQKGLDRGMTQSELLAGMRDVGGRVDTNRKASQPGSLSDCHTRWRRYFDTGSTRLPDSS